VIFQVSDFVLTTFCLLTGPNSGGYLLMRTAGCHSMLLTVSLKK